MRRALAPVVAAVLGVVGVQALADATQNRPDRGQEAEETQLTLDVRTKDRYAPEVAAESLWAACRHTVRATRLVAPMRALDEGRFILTLRPALGPHASRRLFGCLQDATIDDVSGRVVARHDRLPAEGAGWRARACSPERKDFRHSCP